MAKKTGLSKNRSLIRADLEKKGKCGTVDAAGTRQTSSRGDASLMKEGRTSIRIWAVLVWLVLWQLLGMAAAQPIFFVTPLAVAGRFAELAGTAAFWRAMLYSSLRITGGFVLAAASGALLAWFSAGRRRVEELLAPPLLAIRSVPVVSFIILALILFGSRRLSILISFLMGLPVFYQNTLEGLRRADPAMREMAELFRLSPGRYLRYVLLPQLLPYYEAACVTAAGLCWKAGAAAEVIGMPEGSVGERLQRAKVYLETPDLFAWTLGIVLASVLLEKLALLSLGLFARRLGRMR